MIKASFFIPCLLTIMVMVWPCMASSQKNLDIKSFETPKGITAWLVEDKTVPVISMQFLFRGAGAMNDPDGKQGLSQILSNMLDEGAGELNAKDFQAALNDQSISLGFSSSRDNFAGSLKTLTKYQDQAFSLLHMSLTKPRFEQDALRRMKESNLARIKSSMTDAEWMSARLTNATLFHGHPYARNSGGTLSSLPAITADDLKQKLVTQLARDNLMIAIVGNIDEQKAKQVVDDIFGLLPEKAKIKKPDNISFPETKTVWFEKNIPQTVIEINLPAIGRDDPDYAAAEIINYILGGAGFGSRLTESIREQRGLTYGIYSHLSEMDYARLLTIGASTRSENVEEVLSLIHQEISRLTEKDVTSKELADAKSYLIGSVPLGLTSTDRIAATMIGFQIFDLPTNYLDIRENNLKNITKKDIRRIAAKLLISGHIITVMVGKLPENQEKITIIKNIPDIE